MSLNIALLAPTIAAFFAGGGLWLFAYRLKQRHKALRKTGARRLQIEPKAR